MLPRRGSHNRATASIQAKPDRDAPPRIHTTGSEADQQTPAMPDEEKGI